MKQAIANWFFKDAEPWQFWMPQSGPIGGVIAGIVLTAVIVMVVTVGILL